VVYFGGQEAHQYLKNDEDNGGMSASADPSPGLRTDAEGRSHVERRPIGVTKLLVLGGALVLSLGCLLAGPSHAESTSPSAFTGTSSARLVGVDVKVAPTIVFDPLFDGGQSVAQAQLDSLGTSQAFASSVYPGSAVVALPGLLGTLTNGQVGSKNIPRYPLYVDSSYPTMASNRQQVGLYDLSARSASTESTASASDGATSATAVAHLDAPTGEVVARAESTIGELRVNDSLSVYGIHSVAEVRQPPGGSIRRTASFEISAISVLGQRLAVSGNGLEALGGTVPLGGIAQQVLTPVLAQLAAAGTKIEMFPAQQLPDGVQSAGLRMTTTVASPGQLASGVQSATIVLTIGGNTASVSSQVDPGTTGSSDRPSMAGGSLVGDPGVAAPGAVLPSAATSDVAGTAAGPAPSAADRPSPRTSLIANVPSDISAGDLYPVLIAAGVILVGAARLFPHLGRSSA
jgi:hypothetical protein